MTKTMMMMIASLSLGGCATGGDRYCQREGPAHLGDTVYVDGPSVRPERLIEDSRCPVDVQCVRAGVVRVAVTVIGGSATKEIELTLGKPERVADGMLTLLSVQPLRRADRVIAADQYRFTFGFKGGL